jgi:cellulose synthase/poly-beta-1,6-N-acetylglucosamine synthase-like glycosyltransferase
MLTAILLWIFWSAVAMTLIVTFGYPLFLAVTTLVFSRRTARANCEPTVTLIIAAYNEARTIKEKLENTLQLDYPSDKLEVIVASDGSTDETNTIVEGYQGRGIALASFPRTGKTGVQNRMAKRARGEILVFSDANAAYRSDAIRKLVRNFSDPNVGGVSGQLTYHVSGEGAGTSERLYWSYEKFMKQRESDLSSVVGANGSIYAVRRSDYVEIPEDLISDFVEPLAIVRNGKRVIYEPEAISAEDGSASYDTEFRRKVRILTRSIRGLLTMRELLNPLRFGVFGVQLVMHKLLRFLTPLFLAVGALALAGLATQGRYVVLFLLMCLGITAALVAAPVKTEKPSIVVRICHLLYYYLMTNYALVLAWINVLRG